MKSYVNELRDVPSSMNGHRAGLDEKEFEVFFTSCPSRGKYFAMGFIGKGKKHNFYYSFSSEEKMYNYIDSFCNQCAADLESKKARKEAAKKLNTEVTCEVGQIFKYSWGYDQTNVDFYQVTEVRGKKVTLREIGYKTVRGSEGFMCDHVTPVKDNFITTHTITKILHAGYKGVPSFTMPYGSLTLTSENEKSYRSWYA